MLVVWVVTFQHSISVTQYPLISEFDTWAVVSIIILPDNFSSFLPAMERLLQENNMQQYFVEYMGLLSNHMSHGIIALNHLGGDEKRMQRFVDWWAHTLNIGLVCWKDVWARFLSLTWSKLRLCSADHRAGYFSNPACDWLSIVWAYSEQETENGHRSRW